MKCNTCTFLSDLNIGSRYCISCHVFIILISHNFGVDCGANRVLQMCSHAQKTNGQGKFFLYVIHKISVFHQTLSYPPRKLRMTSDHSVILLHLFNLKLNAGHFFSRNYMDEFKLDIFVISPFVV